MLFSVTLTNTQAAILYCLAFAGLWHIIGIPPISTWFKRDKVDPTVVERVNESLGVYGDAMKKIGQ